MQEGDKATLNCTTIRNIAKVFIYWEKDGEELKIFNDSDEFPIYHASCKYDGNYSCFTRDSSLAIAVLKKFVVKVSGTLFLATVNYEGIRDRIRFMFTASG